MSAIEKAALGIAVSAKTSQGGVWVDVVRDFGAAVDNASDDTSAWQNAINYVVAQGGGTVFCSRAGRSLIKGAQQTGTVAVQTSLTSASNSSPIVVSTAAPHGFANGSSVTITGCTGNTAANGTFTVSSTSQYSFTLNGSTGNGSYTGNGSVAGSYNYSGQILFPARGFAQGRAAIRLQGPCPPPIPATQDSPSEPVTILGTVALVSNAASGAIFSAIPSNQVAASGNILTNLSVIFQDMAVLAPSNPTVNGIDAAALACLATDYLRVDVDAPWGTGVSPAGLAYGIITPCQNNEAFVDLHRCAVHRFPTLLKLAEHATLDNVMLFGGTTALLVYGPGSGHTINLLKVLIQSTPTILVVDSSAIYDTPISGSIDLENTVNMMINDPNNRLTGELLIYDGLAPYKGWPAIGAQHLRIKGWHNQPYNGMPDNFTNHPWDTFVRTTDVAGILGASDQSRHIWHNSTAFSCSWTTASGAAKASSFTNGFSLAFSTYYARWGGVSRLITGVFAVGAAGTYDVGLALGFRSDDYSGIVVGLYSGAVQIKRMAGGGFTSLINSSGGAFSSSSTVTLQVVVQNSKVPGAAYIVTAYVNGSTTPAVTYTLLTADLTAISDAANPRYLRDGLYAGSSDAVSTCSSFRVEPLSSLT